MKTAVLSRAQTVILKKGRVPEKEGGTVWLHGKRSLGRSHSGELGLEGLREMSVCPRREYGSCRG